VYKLKCASAVNYRKILEHLQWSCVKCTRLLPAENRRTDHARSADSATGKNHKVKEETISRV